MIEKAILKLVWTIFIQGPLNLINSFNKVLEYLTGGIITDILFGSSKEFQWNNIPMQFWWFVIISLCIFALVFTIQMIILIFKEAVETKTKFIIALQNGVKAFSFMFLIPIFFFLANFIVQNLASAVINNFGNNGNIAQYLYHIGDPNWNPSNSGAPGDFGPPGNIKEYNIMAQLFGTWFMTFAVFIIGITLVQKVIELFFLFVISPIVMIIMVIDDGKAAFTWKDMVVAKFLASTGTLIGFYIFISVTQILLSSSLGGLTGITRSLFIILFLCGGGLATMAFSDMIAHFVGESAGIKEGMASLRSTMAGGMMTMGATKMAGRAMGFAKSKRAQNAMNYGSGGFSAFGSSNDGYNDSNNQQSQPLRFASFRNATSGLAARAGILGLTGLAIGATAVGVSRYKEGRKKGIKAGFKEFGKGIGGATISPFVKLGKALDPGVFKRTKTKEAKENKKENKNTQSVNKNDKI